MTTKFFAILTNLGAAKLANATALGTQLQITHMAVGDGGGVLPLPNAAQTQLIGEKRRAALNSLSVDAANSSQIIAEQVIPETDGGWWIREIGLFDKDGVLIAIANCPETYKPQLQEGSGRTQTVRMVLIISSTEAVTLKIDPSVVLATRKYVDDQVIEVKAYADGLMAAHLAAADPHSQYAPKASPALTGKPTAPTAAKADNSTQLATTAHVKQVVTDYSPLASPALTGKPTAPTAAKTDNSTQLASTAHIKLVLADYAPLASPALTGTPTTPTAAAGSSTQQLANTAFVQAAIAALVASSPAALDTLKELADALGNDPNFATTMTNALAGKMDKAKNGSDIPDVAKFLVNLGLGDGSLIPIGVPLPYPLSAAPTGWLKCNGSTFSTTTYPKLALVYPSGVLPDMRGNAIRGWDDGRGVDTGRALLSEQADAVQNITGSIWVAAEKTDSTFASGAFTTELPLGNCVTSVFQQRQVQRFNFDASHVARTAAETRMRNIAFNHIVRAA
ncbi:phage tail protein [Yersinia mollaretii]|uniref:phage tail protein n=1 Tax=Yersinia mollaretii TaxID=33060 RepID=UPI00061BDE96|nr:phage tail protein [Yersinia mollaretii]CNI39717.1 tail fiber protein [Yersinia mollaretii]